jgi:hypothetical protein
LRFIVALLVAPLVVCSLLAVVLSPIIVHEKMYLMPFFLTVAVWFLGLQALFDLTVSKYCGRVAKAGCVIVGAISGASWSSAFLLLGAMLPDEIARRFGIPRLESLVDLVRDFANPIAMIGMVILVVLAAFGGWIVWHVGVRPAPEPVDVGTVFG